ncbi:ribonuclease H-like domain-containing protein [Mycena galericulata]|nr:ribonuclease H-like domain-containing protein [Mycena galericulata]
MSYGAPPEIAIDLEHNNYRSYSGIVCLIQISTRTQDWIVNTLALRAELATGALVFTDPAVVLHGAESDIVWLQQDLNIYIVNLFDTFHASKLFEIPRHGLANLLEMYCDFVSDKRYQLVE